MDSINTQLLDRIQRNFPISSTPYYDIAQELGLTEAEVISRIKQLKEAGYIRRIGGIFDSRRLGYKSTLCAMKVPPERVEEVAEAINQCSGVTHNYLRNHEYNLWFTLIAPSVEEIENTLESLMKECRINDLLNLPSVNMFKINVDFNLKEA